MNKGKTMEIASNDGSFDQLSELLMREKEKDAKSENEKASEIGEEESASGILEAKRMLPDGFISKDDLNKDGIIDSLEA